MYKKPTLSYGPSVKINDDQTLSASCTMCTFRVGNACTLRRPPTPLESTDTPDWCELKESMLKDVQDLLERQKRLKKQPA